MQCEAIIDVECSQKLLLISNFRINDRQDDNIFQCHCNISRRRATWNNFHDYDCARSDGTINYYKEMLCCDWCRRRKNKRARLDVLLYLLFAGWNIIKFRASHNISVESGIESIIGGRVGRSGFTCFDLTAFEYSIKMSYVPSD